MVFKGPVPPGFDVAEFRRSGRLVRVFQGPTRPGTDVKRFRSSGFSGRAVTSKPKIDPNIARQKAIDRQLKLSKILADQRKLALIKQQKEFFKRQQEGRRQRRIKRAIVLKQNLLKQSQTQFNLSRIAQLNKQIKKDVGDSKVLQERFRKGVEEKVTFGPEQRKVLPGDVQPVEEPKGRIAKLIKKFKDNQKKKSTSSIRNQQTNIKNELGLLGLTIGITIGSGVVALVLLPKTLFNLAKNPKQILSIPSKIKEGGANFGQLIRISPTEAFGKIAGEIFFLKGTGTSLRIVGKVGNKASARLNPKFKGVKGGKINIKTTGKTIELKVGGPISKIQETLSKQVQLAGKKVTAVSVQADKLVGLIKRQKIIRKPIPNEAKLKPSVKRLLKRFDDGTITPSQLVRLQKKVPILERSFFADPRGRFRPSRLGPQQKEAKLLDVLAGDISFKTPKPQILVFENIRVSKFPKALKDVQKALRTGKTLTPSQAKRFLAFQTKKTGKFKPIGKLSREPEITLASGEIIKKVKTLAVTIINGRKVPIVQAKVVKATKSTKKLLKKESKGTLTKKEFSKLKRNLNKETGFKVKTSTTRRGVKSRPRARIPKRVRRRSPKRPKRRTGRPTPRPSPRPTPRPPKRGPRKGPRRRPRRRPVPRTIIPPPPIPRVFRRQGRPPGRPPPPIPRPSKKKVKVTKVTKVKGGFNVFARPLKKRGSKKIPRLIKVNKVPLKKRQARNLRNFIIDESLARSGSIVPTKLKPGRSRLSVPRTNLQKKFRGFKIVKGKRVSLGRGKVIERTKRLLDTKSEKAGIGLRRRLAQLRKKSKPFKRKVVRRKPTKRKITPQQRRILLQRLKKARQVRARNLRRR